MNVFEIFGTIRLNDSGFNRGLIQASQSGDNFGGKMLKVFSGVGKAAAVGLGVAVTAFSGLAKASLDASGELEQNMGGSEAVFKQFAKTVQDKGKTAFKDMGLAQSEFLATANKMGALLQGSGVSMEKSGDLATKAMQRASDVASIMGVDVKTAMESVTGAAKGNFTIKHCGIKTV